MNILVCVKQVIDMESDLMIQDDGRWIKTDDAADRHINYYDTFALEEAMQIKEAFPGVTVDALSLGPDRVESTLRRALALGADHAVHLRTETEGFSDGFSDGFISATATAALIAAVVRPRNYDLILTGVMSEDIMQRLTGPMIAAHCRLPCASSVVEESLSRDDHVITAICELEDGIRETVRLPLPALLTIQSGINRPRYASLSNRLRAKSQVIERIEVNELPTAPPEQYSRAVYFPEKTGTGVFLEGTPREKADALVALLHEKSLLQG